MRISLLVALWMVSSVIVTGSGRAGAVLEYEPVYNFGQIGIGYKAFHNYVIKNTGDEPVKITKATSSCDCTKFVLSDSLISPNDSTIVRVTFETTNYYGATVRAVNLKTDNPLYPDIKLTHNSLIGQWRYYMRPEPQSLFFLPDADPRKVIIPNPSLPEVEILDVDVSHDHVSVRVIEGSAQKGGKLVLEVTPSSDLSGGTHFSSITISISISDGKPPYIVTIPVKVARY